MKYTKRLFLAVFMLAFLTPAVAPAMGERPLSHPMCDTSDRIKEFVLTSGNGEFKETFKVPVRYMSMELERNGATNRSLHLAAILDNLEPSCRTNGEITPVNETLGLKLSINLRPVDEWGKERQQFYSAESFEEIEVEGQADFTFKASRNRPNPVEQATIRYGYIPAYPKRERSIPVPFYIECELGKDMKTLGICRMRFLYNDRGRIAVTAHFPSENLENIEQIYAASIALIKKFHVTSSMEDVSFSPDNYDDIADAMRYLVKKLPLGMQKETAEAFLVNKSGGTAFEMYPNTTSYHFGRTKKHLLSINKNKCKGDWRFEISYDQDQKIQKVRFPCF